MAKRLPWLVRCCSVAASAFVAAAPWLLRSCLLWLVCHGLLRAARWLLVACCLARLPCVYSFRALYPLYGL